MKTLVMRNLDVVVRGEVPPTAVAYARKKVARLCSHIDEPVLHTRLKLTQLPDPAVARPAVAEASIDINGDVVRASVAASTFREAADGLEARLRARLEHRIEHRLARRSVRTGPPPRPRPAGAGRAQEEGEVLRRTTFGPGEVSLDEAAFDMEMLDYSFYLFRDLHTGEDSVLWRRDDGSYGLARCHTAGTAPIPAVAVPGLAEPAAAVPTVPVPIIPVSVVDTPAPTLTLGQAVERLRSGDEPFVFFHDAAIGRGEVLYRRDDGQYGVIVPAEA